MVSPAIWEFKSGRSGQLVAFTPFVETDQPTMAAFNGKFQELLQAALDSDVKIGNGSYVGTGKYGQENPNSLTFSFFPRFLMIAGYQGSDTLMGFTAVGGLTLFRVGTQGFSTIPITLSGNTVTWYSSGMYLQMNASGTTYQYFAIG